MTVVQTINPQPEIITLKTRHIGTMNAIYLGPSCLVESECKPGVWYVVDDGHCSCPGHVYRSKCKHVAVADTAAEIERREAQPVQPPICPKCEKRPVHLVLGVPASTCCRCAIPREND